jgi:hypothetical protein
MQLNIKAHSSQLNSTMGPRLTIQKLDSCRVGNIDATLGGVYSGNTNASIRTVDNESTSGIVNCSFNGSTYKIGQAAGAGTITYKMDATSYGSLINKTLNLGTGTVAYNLVDKAAGVATSTAPVNYSRTGNNVEASLVGIDQALGQVALSNSAEASARIAADANLQSQINSIFSNIDPAALDSLTEVVSAFQSADSDLQAAVAALGTGAASSLADEIARAQAAEADLQDQIDAEEVRAMGVESGLDSRLTTAEGGIESLEGRMDTAESDIDSLETGFSSEVSRATSAEEALDARVDVLEAKTFGKQKIVISTELSYIDLEREVVANSLVVCVNRLSVHKDEDYTVSVVGGKTRLTWVNSFANPDGEEKIEEGDNIFVTFYY